MKARDAFAVERFAPKRWEHAASVLLAVVIGILIGALLAHWSAS